MDWYDKKILAIKIRDREYARKKAKRVFFKRGPNAVVERMIEADGLISNKEEVNNN